MEKQDLIKPTPSCPFPGCGAELELEEPGWYTCPVCGKMFFAEKGEVIERVEWEIHTPEQVQEEHAMPADAPVASTKSTGEEEEEEEEPEETAELETMQKLEPIGDNLRVFLPLTKVDLAKQEVWGFAAVEEPDRAGEIMDYATSKPYFLEWSNEAAKRSDGKSKGNVRGMHSNIAAGKLIQLEAVDARKGFYVGCKVVNPQEWLYVQEGVYTGFSVGGKYIRRWVDQASGLVRYTGKPVELSLVDVPSIPSSTFDLVKADGEIEQMPFKSVSSITVPGGITIQYEGTKVYKVGEPGHTLTINVQPGALPDGTTLTGCAPGAMELVEELNASKKQEPELNLEPLLTLYKPYPNEHAARVREPGDFEEDSFRSKEIEGSKGVVRLVLGRLKGESSMTVQAYRFPAEKYTADEARAWLADNKVEVMAFEPAKPKEEGEKMQKAEIAGALQQARTLVGEISEAPADAGDKLAQLQAIMDVLVDSAPESQNTEMPIDAATAANERGVTILNEGPTSTARKTGVPVEEESTEGKETPTEMESDTGLEPVAKAQAATTDKPEGEQPQEEGDEMNKTEPLSTTPPTVIMSPASNDHLLPAFMQALEGEGSLKKAQNLVGNDQGAFDDLFVKAQRAILNDGGWKYENMGRINTSFPASGLYSDETLAKAITGTDLPNLYLMRLAKLMLPLYAGLRRRIAANPPPIGATVAQWRAQLGSSNFDFAAALTVAEAATGQAINESFLTFQAPFKRSSLNDAVNLEAIYTSRGYDDPLQVAVIRALTFLLGVEERKILGDNSGSIAAPASVTVTGSTTGGTLAAGSYTARVSALTYYGYLANTKTGSPGGETTVATGSVVTTGSTSSLAITWPAVPGAVAYNLYLDNGSNNRWNARYTVNKATITAFPGSGGSHPGTNTTANANGYEGLVSWAELSNIYSQAIPNKTFIDQAGAGLTTYAGGITEFDTLLAALWTNWQIAPSLIICSSDGAKHLTKQLLSANNPAIYRLEIQQERGTISGGAFVTGYVNKFAPFADGTPRVVDVMAHPYFANGSYLFITESIPYPMSREPRGFALEVLIPYTYFPLAQTTIQYPFAMLCSETLECFHPGAQAAIVGVDVTV